MTYHFRRLAPMHQPHRKNRRRRHPRGLQRALRNQALKRLSKWNKKQQFPPFPMRLQNPLKNSKALAQKVRVTTTYTNVVIRSRCSAVGNTRGSIVIPAIQFGRL
jgi:hypothetical protein